MHSCAHDCVKCDVTLVYLMECEVRCGVLLCTCWGEVRCDVLLCT